MEDDIERRKKFYNSPKVAKFLTREGVPKTKQAMIALVSAGDASEKVDDDSIACFGKVVFSVHPQQINVRDKENGKIIASIPK